MKIAHVDHNLASESGDPRMAYHIAQELKHRGHHMILYTLKFDPRFFPDLHQGLEIRQVSGSGDSSVAGQRAIAIAIDPDVDIVLFQDAFRVGAFYRRLVSRKAKTLWIMNSPPFEFLPKQTPLHTFGAWLKAQLSKRDAKKYMDGVDHAVVIDKKGIEYCDVLGIPGTIIPIGVEYKRFYAPVKHIQDGKRIRLLGVGGISRYRRYEDIVKAVAILRKKGYDARALLICKDFGHSPSYRRSFDLLVEREGVKEFIERRYDGASDEELLRAYRESDIYVFPNHVRIWGMAAFEAMAAGLPLIVSRVTSVAEVLEDGRNAIFVDRLCPDQIAERIERLMNDPKMYRDIAEAGQKFVKDFLGWNMYVDKLEAIMKTLVTK